MKKEKLMILSMLEEGKITSEEAIQLLEALKTKDDLSEANFENEFLNIDFNSEEFKNKAAEIGESIGQTISKTVFGLKEMMTGFDFTHYRYHENKRFNFDLDGIDPEDIRINIEGHNGRIEIDRVEEDEIFVIVKGHSSQKIHFAPSKYFKLSFEDGNLIFKPLVSEGFAFDIILGLPDLVMREVLLENPNGEITISNLNFKKLMAMSNNVRLSAINIQGDEVKLKSRNGKINLSSAQARDIKLENLNGSIYLEDIEAPKLELITSNGSIKGSRILSKDLEASSTNGRIALDRIESERIDSTTSNGNIMIGFTKDEAFNFKLSTNMGDMKVDYPDKIIDSQEDGILTRTHIKGISHDIDRKLIKNQLVAKTSNGSIKVYMEEDNE